MAQAWCGNFNTGKVIAAMAEHYTGVDIAAGDGRHTRVHAGEQVHFVRADLTRDALPSADSAIVRQVWQHLTNAEESQAALSSVLHTYSLAIDRYRAHLPECPSSPAS
jgi:hypothetical protein